MNKFNILVLSLLVVSLIIPIVFADSDTDLNSDRGVILNLPPDKEDGADFDDNDSDSITNRLNRERDSFLGRENKLKDKIKKNRLDFEERSSDLKMKLEEKILNHEDRREELEDKFEEKRMKLEERKLEVSLMVKSFL